MFYCFACIISAFNPHDNPLGRYYYCPRFIGEKTEAQLVKVTHQLRARAGVQVPAVWLQSPCSDNCLISVVGSSRGCPTSACMLLPDMELTTCRGSPGSGYTALPVGKGFFMLHADLPPYKSIHPVCSSVVGVSGNVRKNHL